MQQNAIFVVLYSEGAIALDGCGGVGRYCCDKRGREIMEGVKCDLKLEVAICDLKLGRSAISAINA